MIVCTLALALIPAAAMAAVQEGPVVNPANGHQYYLLSPNTWTGAEAEAIAMGGHLVTINGGAENTWVWETFAAHGPLWIGLSDAAQEGLFVWADGEPATYFNWWGSEPNNLGGVENYVEMNNYLWNDNSNGQSFFAVVEVGDIVITPPAPIIVTVPPVAVNAGAGAQTDPHVDGNLVSYTSQIGQIGSSSTEIRYFNFATSVDLSIPRPASGYDFLSDVNGSTVVFTRVEGGKSSIWSFDTATTGPAVELAPLATSNRRGATIGATTVAWQDLSFSTASSEIVAYDLVTGVPVRLTDDLLYDTKPAVAPDGNVIVWEKCATSVSPCDIWQAVKTGGVWEVSQVTDTLDPEAYPDTNGTLVVYSNGPLDLSLWDIHWKPVAGGAESQLAMVGWQHHPNISGNVIAFESLNVADLNPNRDVYVFDLSTSTLYRLMDTPLLEETLSDISVVGTQVRVVWSVYSVYEPGNSNVYSMTFEFPVANAGSDQAVHVGNVVTLDGAASSDPDANYPLSYSWTITSRPAGSAATLSDPAVVNPSFTADLAGNYVIRLVVTDSLGFVGAASSVTIAATGGTGSILSALAQAINAINQLAPVSFKNQTMANALTNKINAAIQMIDQGLYQSALDKLQNDIIAKTDGCATAGAPDKNDWLTNCAAQGQVYPFIIEAINLLKLL